jgi:energy-coupling factor transporter ATP-binding protein EcfA2
VSNLNRCRKKAKPMPAEAKADTPRPPDAATLIVRMVDPARLWHGPDGTAYLDCGRAAVRVRGTECKRELAMRFFERMNKVASAEAIANAVNVLEYLAMQNPEHVPHIRFAARGETRYVALYDDANTVIAIDAAGWRVCHSPPVKFVKPPTARPLPFPEPGGTVGELWPFLNLPDADTRSLLLGWLAAAVNASGSAPVLAVFGPQGCGKTTTARLAQRLLDPTAAEAAALPRDVRDLAVAADHAAVLAFDNVSYLSSEMSDALCRLATGSSFVVRSLYSDGELKVFQARRPIVLNGITDFATRPDLLDRAVLLRHSPLNPQALRTDADLAKAFEAARPRLLGVVFDRVAAGLRHGPPAGADFSGLRMQDFARFAAACEAGCGEPPRLLNAYRTNRTEGQSTALDDSPIAAAVVAFMESRDYFEGTMRELLGYLTPDKPPRDWPTQPNKLSAQLARLAPALRAVHGIAFNKSRTKAGAMVTLARGDGAMTADCPPSPPENCLFSSSADGGDDGDGAFPLPRGGAKYDRSQLLPD